MRMHGGEPLWLPLELRGTVLRYQEEPRSLRTRRGSGPLGATLLAPERVRRTLEAEDEPPDAVGRPERFREGRAERQHGPTAFPPGPGASADVMSRARIASQPGSASISRGNRIMEML